MIVLAHEDREPIGQARKREAPEGAQCLGRSNPELRRRLIHDREQTAIWIRARAHVGDLRVHRALLDDAFELLGAPAFDDEVFQQVENDAFHRSSSRSSRVATAPNTAGSR